MTTLQHRNIRINRTLSRLGIFDFTRVAIYLERGMTLPQTLLIGVSYNIGCLIFNSLSHKLKNTCRDKLQLSTILKLIFFITLVTNKTFIGFCLGSALMGISDTLSTVNTDTYVYAVYKDDHPNIMQKVIADSTIIALFFNVFVSLTFQIAFWLPVVILCFVQLAVFFIGNTLPNIEITSKVEEPKKKQSTRNIIEQIRKDVNTKQISLLVGIMITVKVVMVLMIKTKPYYLKALPFSTKTLGLIDTAAQLGQVVSRKVPKKYKTLEFVPITLIALMFVTIISPFVEPLYYIPYMLITPFCMSSLMPVISKTIGDYTENSKQMSRILNYCDLVNNIVVIAFLFIISKVFVNNPFYYGYFVALPIMLLGLGFITAFLNMSDNLENATTVIAVKPSKVI